MPYNKQLTNRACSSRTGEYWPSRSVSKRLVFEAFHRDKFISFALSGGPLNSPLKSHLYFHQIKERPYMLVTFQSAIIMLMQYANLSFFLKSICTLQLVCNSSSQETIKLLRRKFLTPCSKRRNCFLSFLCNKCPDYIRQGRSYCDYCPFTSMRYNILRILTEQYAIDFSNLLTALIILPLLKLVYITDVGCLAIS